MAVEPTKILVVEDEAGLRDVLSKWLQHRGYAVHVAADVPEAEARVRRSTPDIIVSDIMMPGASGLELLKRLRANGRRIPVILITAHGSIATAVEAIKAGATDFLTKPVDLKKLAAVVEVIVAERAEREEARDLGGRRGDDARLPLLVGRSASMRELHDLVEVVASSDASALITGESGTGKEVVARTIHELSERRAGPFVAVNAAAIPEGLIESELFGHERGAFTGAVRQREGCFEQANRGTLFLDELAEMPAVLQPKLLRILEEGSVRRVGGARAIPFDVRVIAATNRDPSEAVREGILREDLYYRLNVFEISVPALRERMDDLPLLAQHFIREFNSKHRTAVVGLRDSARAAMEACLWPGNVRELRNVLERAVILAREDWIDVQHLPPYIRATGSQADPMLVLPLGSSAAEVEKRLILETLEHVGYNKAEAARRLKLDVKTIRNKLKEYEGHTS
jgi:DNA-binding NtrC family response regulator